MENTLTAQIQKIIRCIRCGAEFTATLKQLSKGRGFEMAPLHCPRCAS